MSSKLRKSARGQDCTLQIVGVCNHNAETTVLAHLPSEWNGMGKKSPDWCSCFACSDCHDVIDKRVRPIGVTLEDMEWYMRRAMVRTWKILVDEGYIEVKLCA